MSTYLMTVHPDDVNGMYDNAKTRLLLHAERSLGAAPVLDYLSVRSGPDIAQARNTLVRTAVGDPGCAWLLFIDADMVFPPDLLDRMMAHADPEKVPILGALCFAGGHSGSVVPVLKVLSPESNSLNTVFDYPSNTLLEVDATGAACLLVHRSVYEKVTEAYELPFEITKAFGTPVSEDTTFCLRARSLGVPIHVHTGIRVGHMKTQVLDEDSYVAYRRGITTMGEDAYLMHHLARLHLVEEADARDRP